MRPTWDLTEDFYAYPGTTPRTKKRFCVQGSMQPYLSAVNASGCDGEIIEKKTGTDHCAQTLNQRFHLPVVTVSRPRSKPSFERPLKGFFSWPNFVLHVPTYRNQNHCGLSLTAWTHLVLGQHTPDSAVGNCGFMRDFFEIHFRVSLEIKKRIYSKTSVFKTEMLIKLITK